MFTADWALRRVLKFVLKRSLGRYLQTELDLDQLDVQLAAGAVELRSVLLNCDTISAALVRPGLQMGGMAQRLPACGRHAWPPCSAGASLRQGDKATRHAAGASLRRRRPPAC